MRILEQTVGSNKSTHRYDNSGVKNLMRHKPSESASVRFASWKMPPACCIALPSVMNAIYY